MLEKLLVKEESKILEFKENTQSLQKIIQTIIAFANTAGGKLVVGVRDKTKEVVGLVNALQDEEKIANAVAESIAPQLFPTFHLYTWRGKDVLIIVVSHTYGPYHLKAAGVEKGTYMRLGSTNRLADAHTISEINRLKENRHFDEQLNSEFPLEQVNFTLAEELFESVSKKFTSSSAQSLGLIVTYQNSKFPSNAAVLLFGYKKKEIFPNAVIRLGRFLGTDKTEILDHQDLHVPLTIARDQIIHFIRRHTSTRAEITPKERIDIPQYLPGVVREAVINALVHADYSNRGASISIAIFDDRIEITNPGALPYGLSLESALSGVSQLRNRVIGHVFRELNLIEQWGSGLGRMIATSIKEGVQPPKFEEVGNFFRTTLYHAPAPVNVFLVKPWHAPIIKYLQKHNQISAKQAQKLWNVTARTTTSRLKQMCKDELLVEIATSPYDPHKVFSLVK